MPGTDRALDPVTHDYVSDDRGGWATTTTLATALQHQLLDELGGWWGDPDVGSDLAAAATGAKASERTMQRLAEAVRRACAPFLERGLAADLEVTVDRNQLGAWGLRASIRDVQHGTLDLTPLLPFGG